MELVNVTYHTSKMVGNIKEDFNPNVLDKTITYNSSFDSLSTFNSIEDCIFDASFNMISKDSIICDNTPLTTPIASPDATTPDATLKATPVATLRPDFMSPHPNNNYIKNNIKNNKRTYINAFEELTLEDDRYGQHIGTDFFIKNIGHNYTNSNSNDFDDFDAYYQANRNLFNV
jgi:hypothetical protein